LTAAATSRGVGRHDRHSACSREDVVSERRIHERRLSERRAKRSATREALWQSSCNIIGFSIETSEGPLGRVEALCLEEESLIVTEIVVATAGRRRRRILVPLSAVAHIDAQARKLYLKRLPA